MLVNYVSDNELKFGQDSVIGGKWYDRISARRFSTSVSHKQRV
jgi:hypothetical protein